jgi:hypothetical protein
VFKNYFKTAWRNIVRSKDNSALNIFGLATGMAVALLIGYVVHHEYSYDKFLPSYSGLYKVHAITIAMAIHSPLHTTSVRLAEALRTECRKLICAESDLDGLPWFNGWGSRNLFGWGISGVTFLRCSNPFAAGQCQHCDEGSLLNCPYQSTGTAYLAMKIPSTKRYG